jgi:predicted negative regulator of RcsB-dependent stress response
MSDNKAKTEKTDFRTLLTIFLSRNRMVFLVIVVVILVLLAGVGIYTSVHNGRIEKSAAAADELQRIYEEWTNAAEAEKAEKESLLVKRAEEVIGSFKTMYAAQRAHLVLGRFHHEKKEWDQAVEEFVALADTFPKSYLAPIALMSAATAHEEAGRTEDAISCYQRIRENYAESFPDTAHALFSIGRLYETIGQEDAALAAYNEVVDDFSSSSWTNQAQDRIIYLEAVN